MYLRRYHDVQISPSGVWRIHAALLRLREAMAGDREVET